MTFEEYLKLPIESRKEIIKQPIKVNTPFWQERLTTAIEYQSPLCLIIDDRLVKEYWDLVVLC